MSVLRKKGELSPEEHRKRTVYIVAIIVITALTALFCVFIGMPLLRFFSEPEAFRAWMDDRGFWAYLAFLGMMVLQVIIAFIPGEPLEIAAGYAFGMLEGTLLCMLACAIGGFLVFKIVRRWGVKVVEIFFSAEKIQSIKFLHDRKRLGIIVFILFFIPGTPKDVLTYCVGLTDIKLSHWLLISTFARIPSIVTSTISGDALGLKQYVFAIIAFGITLLISLAGLFIYRRFFSERVAKKSELTPEPEVTLTSEPDTDLNPEPKAE